MFRFNVVHAAVLILGSCFLAFGQNSQVPYVTMLGSDARPEKPLLGPVRTVLSVTYHHDQFAETMNETYDIGGKLLETTSFRLGDDGHTTIVSPTIAIKSYRYSPETGGLSEVVTTEENGRFAGSTTFAFDKAGRLVEELRYFPPGNLRRRFIYEYLPESLEVIRSHFLVFDGRTSLFEKRSFTLNREGRLISVRDYDLEGQRWKDDATNYEYDKSGNLIKETNAGRYNYTRQFAYKFDSRGNWVERIETYTQRNTKKQAVRSSSGGSPTGEDRRRTYRVLTYF